MPGLPLPTKRRQTTGASTLLTLSAFWPGLGPVRLTTSPFPASETRQGLRIHAARFPPGSCGALGPAWSLRGKPPGGPLALGREAECSQQLFPPCLSLSAALGPESPPIRLPQDLTFLHGGRVPFPSPGVQARPGLQESQRFPKVKSVSHKEAPQTQIPEPRAGSCPSPQDSSAQAIPALGSGPLPYAQGRRCRL